MVELPEREKEPKREAKEGGSREERRENGKNFPFHICFIPLFNIRV